MLTSLSNSEGVASNFSKGSTGVGTKKRFKGIPQQYIIPDMYKHLIENEGNTVQVDFLKFKREWGSVKGYIEEKTLKAT